MRAGPKGAVTAGDLDLSVLPAGRDWRRVEAFCRKFLRVPRGHGALEALRLRPWQREIVKGLFPARGARPRQGLVSLPRGNGKSTLAAALGLYALLADDEEGAEVLVVASDERQARIVWNAARRMVELDERLAARCHIYQDRITFPQRDATFAPLPAEPSALQGWQPSLVVVDELHVVNEQVWEAMNLASGKRAQSLTLAISTPSDNRDSVMWRLVEVGRSGADPSFYYREFAAPEGCEVDDEAAWKLANPALGDFLALDALRANLRTTRPEVFRRFRLGQWVGNSSSWLPWGAWDALVDDKPVPPQARIVAGFDGSTSGDSSALIGVIPGPPSPHVFVIDLWESEGAGWRVPRHDVEASIAAMFATYNVVEFAVDPWGWQSEIEGWEATYGARRVLRYNTGNARLMGPATDRVYQHVAEGTLTHDGDPRLSRHVANAVPKPGPHGDVITKDRHNSPRKIDAAVAMILAVDRAAEYANGRGQFRAMGFR